MRVTSWMRSVALVATLGLVLAGCGDDEDDAAALSSLAEAGGRTIGVQSATTGESYADANAPEGTVIQRYENPGDLFTALQAGQIDGVLQDLPVNAEFARENDGYEVVETFDTGEQYGFAVAEEGSEDLLEAIDAALTQLREGGFYDAVFEKYFSTESAGGELPEVEASEELASADLGLIEDGVLTVCSDVPYPPFEFEDEETGEFTGFDIELMRAIAAKLGVELQVRAVGFEALQSGVALNSDQCDVVASAMTITEEREQNLDFSQPYYDAEQSLLVRTAD